MKKMVVGLLLAGVLVSSALADDPIQEARERWVQLYLMRLVFQFEVNGYETAIFKEGDSFVAIVRCPQIYPYNEVDSPSIEIKVRPINFISENMTNRRR